ncbi:hypothetical protein D9756_005096 [Leucocoprinus leucothites]|uniref:DUF5648 domain-containing protein n=1 Tax=Leucocoprinus leucothites TaxID=201217 RepID=A0A8H5LKP0_9AGAR|nr:hypothetical protein D9756_005096 [Leucoagaricus leucothites]
MQLNIPLVSFIALAFTAVAANATTNTSSSVVSTKTVTYCPTTTPVPVCPPLTQTIPLRRMWNGDLTSHFYSTYGLEVAQFGTQGYSEEPPQGRVYATQVDGTVPLWRCNLNQGTPQIDYFYTADAAEFQAQVAGGCQVMPDPAAAGISQGIGYLHPRPQCNAVPLYRLYSSARFDHFYTINETERQNNINTGLYADQGITGYVIPN